MRREKWLAQIFRKYLTERKPERIRTKVKVMLSASPSLVFSHKLGPLVSEPSTRISKFYDPTDSEHKFHKARIENWLSIGF